MTETHFLCELCGDHCVSSVTNEEAMAEMRMTYKDPLSGDEKPSVCCDECHTKLLDWVRANHPEKLLK